MKYNKIVSGTFLSRPNRFIAHVNIQGHDEVVHVKNTGRCRELLQPGARVYLEDYQENLRKRKTRYSLVAVEKILNNGKTLLVNMDSQAPNKVVSEGLSSGVIKLPGFEGKPTYIKHEKIFGDSRFDFYLEGLQEKSRQECKAFIEVKGVTLEEKGVVKFPDAPTLRGVKHLEEFRKAVNQGYMAYVIFVIQMKGVFYFSPNDEMHPQFGQALREAAASGVHILAYDCQVTKDEMKVADPVEVKL
jgi:sugar fermentation stimulation protein A